MPPTKMKKDALASFDTFQLDNWCIKASILDDQILLVLQNKKTLTTYCEMFYSEELAHSFIERVLQDDD